MGSFTLILSRGTSFVCQEQGEAVLAAMAAGEPFVTVDVDLLGDGFVRRGVRLALTHVVAVVPNDEELETVDEIPYGPNVAAFRQRRAAR